MIEAIRYPSGGNANPCLFLIGPLPEINVFVEEEMQAGTAGGSCAVAIC